MTNSFNQDLLELKRKKFFEAVYRSCHARGVPMPAINFDGCPEEDDSQLAHHHTYTNTICVSSKQLTKLNFDEIYNTATHEAAHVTEHDHESGFHEEHQKGRIAAFRPPGGVVVIDGGAPIIKRPKQKIKVDKKRCNYHLCRKKEKLSRCQHCVGFFCPAHIKAKPSGTPFFQRKGVEGHLLMEEWRTPGGHPCAPYFDYWRAENKKKADAYLKALNELLKKEGPVLIKKSQPETRIIRETGKNPGSLVVQPTIANTISKAILLLIVLVLVTAGVYIAYSVLNPTAADITITSLPSPEQIVQAAHTEISFADYFSNKEKYVHLQVKLTGYLRNRIEGTENSGVYVYTIVDDFGNEIYLKTLNENQKTFFAKRQTTKERYAVTGMFSVEYGGKVTLSVSQIAPAG